MNKKTRHQPVLLQESLMWLNIQQDDIVVDATLGGGGHARAIAEHLKERGVLLGIDTDSAAIVRAREALVGVKAQVILTQANFRELEAILKEHELKTVHKVLFDLGWSSDQLEASGRGFTFSRDEPLLMTLSDAPEKGTLTAEYIVNEWSEESIADALYGWGEERFARRIAKAIVLARSEKPIRTTGELAAIVKEAVPAAYRAGKRHPATKTFQALRIAVNDEIGALTEGLTSAIAHLTKGGRVAAISFHSIEDRTVKQLFRNAKADGAGNILTKKPVVPTRVEVQQNPRARSAKLRVFQKA
ncbi:MAG: 16S rRNA (cytosine(1402)-N(4))-methyltransferase RsmH [bacterium]|nr:16S rRNA (cytosine(1402)-N(4))-methyltransferase RsmH [bacterium]